MNRRTALLAAAALLGGAAMAGDTNTPAPPRNTLWVWHQSDPVKLASLAVKYKVARLLVWVSPGFTRDRATGLWLSRLAVAADPKHIALDALCGDPSWAQTPYTAGTWADEVRGSGRFERVHLDIEPHALPSWDSDQAQLITGLCEAIARAKRSSQMPVDADIPSWYWTVKLPTGTADRAILSAADSITLMSYQDQGDKTLMISKQQMLAAAEAGKPAYIGINLMPAPPEDPGSSMAGQTKTVIDAAIKSIGKQGSGFRAFAGVAIHEAASLSQL